ncbi:MAG TPA: pirin family protein [Steroidobacteraceae bacterium]|nr:pirin family protein [Steroidobacteraceae bacterium]
MSDPPDMPAGGAVETVVVPRARDLGGFEVRRVLPSAQRHMVGPFIFWDQMGPAHFASGHGIDVRPHPHIGLATVTYLLRGEIMHRDSLGSVVAIRPGEMNLMTAGSGIVHSERTGPALRADGHELFGVQAWVALPRAHEESEAAFAHFGAGELPLLQERGVDLRLIAGEMHGVRSPVTTPMAMIYADLALAAGAELSFDARYPERAVYTMEGELELAGERFAAGQMLVLKPGQAVTLRGSSSARCMLLGGEPADGPRHIWWNFVSSSLERIEQAKADWRAGRFAAVPDETEFIPLPET